MFDQKLEKSIRLAYSLARERNHEFVTIEHLLIALLSNTSAVEVLSACEADIESLKDQLSAYVMEHAPTVEGGKNHAPKATVAFKRILHRAVTHVQSSTSEGKKPKTEGANVLVAIFSEQNAYANYLLASQDIERVDVVNYLSHGIRKDDSFNPYDNDDESTNGFQSSRPDKKILESFTVCLNEKAKNGQIDPLIGRELELERIIQILCRRRKNNPLLVGTSGVGKTAIAEGLARLIVRDEVHEVMRDKCVYALDLGAILAGTKYRGDFENRFKKLLKHLTEDKNAILFIDEIHMLVGAGAASSNSVDASNLIKPLLASGQLKCIGATTHREYRAFMEKDQGLVRRFQKIEIEEPSRENTLKILLGLRKKYEEFHSVRFSRKVLQTAVELGENHIEGRAFPDKAIDIIDEIGARLHMKRTPDSQSPCRATVRDVERVVSRIARIPARHISNDESQAISTLERDLNLVVFSQKKAISLVVRAIKAARAGLKELEKPVGSFLFAGPTGVGKTEVAKQVSALTGIPLVRFDMSEYMERHTVSRLIGAPPGYVGFDQGGLLTDRVLRSPHSVLLFDEIEKAHPDVFNLLLQVMDHAELTDTNGRKVNFSNVLIIMTTNAGAHTLSEKQIGFAGEKDKSDCDAEIRRMFLPEFRNRLDAIVHFNFLNHEAVLLIVDKFVSRLQSQLEQKRVQLELSDGAREWLAKKGFDETMGARPMERMINSELRTPLLDEILFGKLAKGGGAKFKVVSFGKGLEMVATPRGQS